MNLASTKQTSRQIFDAFPGEVRSYLRKRCYPDGFVQILNAKHDEEYSHLLLGAIHIRHSCQACVIDGIGEDWAAENSDQAKA